MPSVKVSVIVPVYNQQAYLTQCLESLQNQTLREIEILCDDHEFKVTIPLLDNNPLTV